MKQRSSLIEGFFAPETGTHIFTTTNSTIHLSPKMLAKNFGLKVNGDAFLSMAKSIDFSVVRKEAAKQNTLEALLFGQSGLLNDDMDNSYFQELKQCDKDRSTDSIEWEFMRLLGDRQ